MDNRIPSDDYTRIINSQFQGPRLKSQASYDLEFICKAYLDSINHISCQLNYLNELEILINGKSYNLTSLLKSNYDFSHFAFSDAEKEAYAAFINHNVSMPPYKHSNSDTPEPFVNATPLPIDYENRDPGGKHRHLSYAEKLAITIYTTPSFATINTFLRSYGQLNWLMESDEFILNSIVKEILLATAMATSGLIKTQALISTTITNEPKITITENKKKIVEPPSPVSTQILFRKEITHKGINELRDQTVGQSTTIKDTAFTSTSAIADYADPNNTDITYLEFEHSHYAKDIKELSIYPREEELLFQPGLEYIVYKKEDSNKYSAIPVRPATEQSSYRNTSTIDRIQSDLLSMLKTHEVESLPSNDDLEMMKQLLLSNNAIDELGSKYIDSICHWQKLNEETKSFIQHIQYVYDKFLCKPYLDRAICSDDLKVNIDGIIIHRPNHGLAHTLRMTFVYFHDVINYLIDHVQNPSIKTAGQEMRPDDEYNMQMALLFTIVGRQSEVSFTQNPNKQCLYKKISAQQYRLYAKTINIPDAEIDMYAAIIEHLGNPAHLLDNPTIAEKYKFALIAMNLTHRLDLARCYSPEDYAHALEKTYDVVTLSTKQQIHLLQLIKLATKSIRDSGDRLMTDLSTNLQVEKPLKELLIPSDKKYDKRFCIASKKPEAFLLKCNKNLAFYIASNTPTPATTIHAEISDQQLFDLLYTCVDISCINIIPIILNEMKKRNINVTEIIDNTTLLYNAALNNNTWFAEILLQFGANPNIVYEDSLTPLHIAADQNNIPLMKLLAINGANLNVNASDGLHGYTPAHQAIASSHNIFHLLELGANPNAIAAEHQTLMHLAITTRNLLAAKDLTKFKCNLNQANSKGVTPFQLIRNKFRLDPDYHQGFEYCIYYDSNVIEMVNALESNKDSYLLKAIFNCAIKDIFEKSALYKESDFTLKTLLLDMMIKKGVNPYQDLPIIIRDTANANDTILLEILIKSNIDPYHIFTKAYAGMNILHIAVALHHLGAVKVLLKHYPNLLTTTTNTGSMPIHLITGYTKSKQLEIIKLLISYGADINTRENNNRQFTLLHHTVLAGNVKMTETLLDLGADINATTHHGSTSLLLAVKKKDVHLIKLLLTYHPDLSIKDSKGRDAFSLAVEKAKEDNFKLNYLLLPFIMHDRSFIDKLDKNTDADLLKALFKNYILSLISYRSQTITVDTYDEHKKIISAFIKNGIDINAKSSKRNSIFHALTGKPSILLFRLLRELGADPYSTDHQHRNLLHHYFNSSNPEPELILFLLKEHAELADQRDIHGNKPFFDQPVFHFIRLGWTDSKFVDSLLEITNINERSTTNNRTPLELAIEMENFDFAEELLDKGADLLLPTYNATETILEDAAKTVKHFFNNKPIRDHFYRLINTASSDNSAALLFAALTLQDGEAINMAMERHYQTRNAISDLVNKKKTNTTEIIKKFFAFAIHEKLDKFIDDLFELPLDITLFKSDIFEGVTAINFACANGHLLAVNKLLHLHVQDNDETKFIALANAIVSGNMQLVNLLLSHDYRLDYRIKNEKACWYYLLNINNQSIEMVNFLKKNGVDYNTPCKSGNYILHLAIQEKASNLVLALLENHANPNLINIKNQSPLRLSVASNQPKIASSLLEFGANPLENKDDLPHDLANLAIKNDDFSLLTNLLISVPSLTIFTKSQAEFIYEHLSTIASTIINKLKTTDLQERKLYYQKLMSSSLRLPLNRKKATKSPSLFQQPQNEHPLMKEILDAFPELEREESYQPS